MTIHIGEITSEVTVAAPSGATGEERTDPSPWERRARLDADLARLARDRRRTSTEAER